MSTVKSRWASKFNLRLLNSPGLTLGQASLIIPRLYLTDLHTAMNEERLCLLGVTHIISILDFRPDFPTIPDTRRLHVELEDVAYADILARLDETTQFVKSALEENETNVVLIHCFQGVSRSATIVCAYLIATTGMTAVDSIAFVQSKRSVVSPNLGFRRQLEEYASRFEASKICETVVPTRAELAGGKRNALSDGIAARIRQLKQSGGSTTGPASTPVDPLVSSDVVEGHKQ